MERGPFLHYGLTGVPFFIGVEMTLPGLREMPSGIAPGVAGRDLACTGSIVYYRP